MERTRTLILTMAGAAVGTIMVARTANAEIIEARFNGVYPGQTIEYSINGGVDYHQTAAGYFNWTRIGGDYNGGGASGEFITFCIEVTEHIQNDNTYEYTVMDPSDAPIPGSGMGNAKALLLRELFGRYYADNFAQEDAAAFQAAVWEITFDDGLVIDDGSFRMKAGGTALQTAQGWLDTLDGSGPMMEVAAMASIGTQDQIFIVPSPASGMLAAAGLLLVGARRRRA